MKKVIEVQDAPGAIGPYSQAINVGRLIITSGQLPINPQTGEFPCGGIGEQTRQSLENIVAILRNVGASTDNIVKTTVYLKDMNDFSTMNQVYSGFFTSGIYPARSAIEVARLPKDALVEIEAVAVL